MKKVIIAIVALMAVTNIAEARSKKVTLCSSSFFISTTAELTCNGHFNGKTTMLKLYSRGWRYVGDLSRADNFVLIFEK